MTLRERGTLAIDERRAPASARKTIGTAVLISLLNPKLTIFFFAFLPQFVAADAPAAAARMLALSLVFMAMTFVVFAVYGALAAAVREQVILLPRVMARMRRAFAGSFVALGAKLAFTRP